jgi:hypothetical protein
MDALDELIASDPISSLFTEVKDGGKEDTLNMTGRANDGFADFTVPGQKAKVTDPVEEDQLSKNFVSIKERQVIEWEAYLHDKYQFVADVAGELGKKVMNSFALALTHQLFNYSDATTVTLPGNITYNLATPDAAALVSASHTTPSGLTSLTNIGGTGALSIDNLTANILVGQENMRTSNGTAMVYNPDLLIVPNVQPMIEKSKQNTGSTLVESTANNAINIYGGGSMRVVVLNYAPLLANGSRDTSSKKYRWATAQSDLLKKALVYKWASRPVAYPKFMDEENGDSAYLVMARFAFGAARWQGYVQNNSTTPPSSAA